MIRLHSMSRLVIQRTIIAVGAVLLMLLVVSSRAFAKELGAVTQKGVICKFETNEAYYATVSSPAEPLSFSWNQDTGTPEALYWLHGGIAWYLYQHGYIGLFTREVNYYDVELWMSTASHDAYAYSLKGKLTVDVHRPSGATFAGIWEGTGTAWLVADGTLTCG